MSKLQAVLGGAEDSTDMALFGRAKEEYFRLFLRLPHGIPSHDTFSRLFRLLNPAQFHACFLTFMQRFGRRLAGRRGAGRQDPTPLLRPRRRTITLALSQCLGRRAAARARAGGGRRQKQ